MSSNTADCPVCLSTGARCFFQEYGIPTQSGYLAPTREKALLCQRGDITLHYCGECGHVWNSSYDPELMHFDDEYEFSQYHSPLYREYIARSIGRLMKRYDLAGKTALDIACGKGDFLRMLLAAGMARGFGFDPTFVDDGLTDDERGRITVYREFYSAGHNLEPHLVSCRSALQYMPRPRRFLESLRSSLGSRHEAVVYIEVPNGAEPLRERVVWYAGYEAGCFFSSASLGRLFRECGFQVLDVRPALGTSHIEIEARPSDAPRPYPSENRRSIEEIGVDADAFASENAKQIEKWSERFEGYQREGRNVVLWAAGMRAISLLTRVEAAAKTVEHVVDINPQRWGRYLPATGQRVIAPEDLRHLHPDVVIATNRIYGDEIRVQVEALGVACEFDVLR